MNIASFKTVLLCALLVPACGIDHFNTPEDVATGVDNSNSDGWGSSASSVVGYKVTELVTSATDPQLLNPWGIVGAEGVFWIADEVTGRVSVYDGNGKQDDEYPTGTLAPGPGSTGLTRNEDEGEFLLKTSTDCMAPETPAEFIFANTNGTLVATNDFTRVTGLKVVDRSAAGAIYLGVTKVDTSNGPILLAADFGNGRLDMFDSKFALIPPTKAFIDPQTPAGYGPFNVLAIGDIVFVMYAKIGEPGEEDAGPGLGRVSLFDTNGDLIGRLKSDLFNAPWGVTVAEAPSKMCDGHSAARTILVGNFGDGRIEQFDADTLESLGQLADENQRPIEREGLWGLSMGSDEAGDPDALYFVQGAEDETAGIYGRIDRL